MFGPVTTAEAHVAFAGASHHTNKTAELSGITESLHFLCLAARFPRSSRVCIFHDTRHAADVCLGSVQSLTNVRLALQVNHICCQYNYEAFSHYATSAAMAGNVGNECARPRRRSRRSWPSFWSQCQYTLGPPLFFTRQTSSEAATTLLRFNTGYVTLVVNTHHCSRLVLCFVVNCALASLYLPLRSETTFDLQARKGTVALFVVRSV